MQTQWVKNYEDEVSRLRMEVENIDEIRKVLPVDCQKRLRLEPWKMFLNLYNLKVKLHNASQCLTCIEERNKIQKILKKHKHTFKIIIANLSYILLKLRFVLYYSFLQEL